MTPSLVRALRSAPFVLVLLVPAFACGGAVQGGAGDAGQDAAREDAGRASCASLGGTCGSTPDLPCQDGTTSLREGACEGESPCCVALPPLGPGECRTGAECASQTIPGRSPGAGSCEGGACVCDASSVLLENRRCGPTPEAGESYLCTIGTAFPRSSALCGVVRCDAGAVCAPSPSGGSAQCIPPVIRRGEETCILVNCGSIYCARGLSCTDAERGVCKPE